MNATWSISLAGRRTKIGCRWLARRNGRGSGESFTQNGSHGEPHGASVRGGYQAFGRGAFALAKVEGFLKEGPTADFVIGAHALVQGYTLLTLDEGMYRAAYPRLGIVAV